MCGVAAFIGDRAEHRVEQMLGRMNHRGVRQRIETFRGGAIGHRRLPIVGVSDLHDQPKRRGPWKVAFVGEVLDFREVDPRYECDAEYVADRWYENGPECLIDNDGFWAVVAADEKAGDLVCLVDYLCQKPLYTRIEDGFVAVASELDALACLGPVTLDETYLSAVVKWGYCPEVTRTPYVDVQRMGPGECVRLDRHGVSASYRPDVLHLRSLGLAQTRTEVEDAVRRRVLSADVPVACLLSGGLDSSIVRVLAGRYGDVRTYHVSNDGDDCSAVDPRARVISLGDGSYQAALEYMQEPIDLGSLLPQVALSDAIGDRGGERVCLTGDGADELFGGYGRSMRYDSQASDVWHELVAWHLPRLDRVMMRNRIEVRSPFLARRVVEGALALPWSERRDKSFLRDVFRADLPPGVADRKKIPLRTTKVESDREAVSSFLVNLFRDRTHEKFGGR